MELDFPRRLLDAAAVTGLDAPTVNRHLPMLSSCIPDDDHPALFARVDRADDRACCLLLLTSRRLVVTAESRILRRRSLHLNADPRHLLDVLWTPEPTLGGLALAATAIDGVRENFWVRTLDPDAAAAALTEVFRPVTTLLLAAA
jgi:hypothetical protein